MAFIREFCTPKQIDELFKKAEPAEEALTSRLNFEWEERVSSGERVDGETLRIVQVMLSISNFLMDTAQKIEVKRTLNEYIYNVGEL